MSKKDFQNGFALGLASGGVVEIEKEEQEKSIDITENGTTEVTPDEGKTLSKVTVNVEVESGGTDGKVMGIIFSEFTGIYNMPTVADLRSIPAEMGNSGAYWYHLFGNYSTSGNGGLFTSLKEVYLPDGILSIGNAMFQNCGNLTTIYADFSNLTSIPIDAFNGCTRLLGIPYTPKLQSIARNAFLNCTSLTEITLPSTVTSIVSSAFSGCSGLTKIKCLFPEGSVTGAPWGAPNADIVEYVTEV